MTEATNNLLPPAATPQAITLARWLARKAVKTEWHKQGLRWQHMDGRQLAHEAKVYLNEHPELIDRGPDLQRQSLCKCHARNGGWMIIGYARVSTDGQTLNAKHDALHRPVPGRCC